VLTPDTLPSTASSEARATPLLLVDGAACGVRVLDDHYSDRIRCDHPPEEMNGAELGRALLRAADDRGRGRVVVFSAPEVASELELVGFRTEARMPGFYRGDVDCIVSGAYPEGARAELARPDEVDEVLALCDAQRPSPPVRSEVVTRRAAAADVDELAALLAETFRQYPTPSGDPAYLVGAIEDGVPFRFVEVGGEIVACASADLVRSARTAELTDCATLPEHRGNGFMQAILLDLMDDLRELGYPSAFTLARARIPGVNLAFQRLGFSLRGTMTQSCRIGEGIEDMNVWSRRLEELS